MLVASAVSSSYLNFSYSFKLSIINTAVHPQTLVEGFNSVITPTFYNFVLKKGFLHKNFLMSDKYQFFHLVPIFLVPECCTNQFVNVTVLVMLLHFILLRILLSLLCILNNFSTIKLLVHVVVLFIRLL